jgi:hypothetical protein
VAAAACGYPKGDETNQEMRRTADSETAAGQHLKGLGVHDGQGLAGGLVSGSVCCFFQFPFDDGSFA